MKKTRAQALSFTCLACSHVPRALLVLPVTGQLAPVEGEVEHHTPHHLHMDMQFRQRYATPGPDACCQASCAVKKRLNLLIKVLSCFPKHISENTLLPDYCEDDAAYEVLQTLA